MPTPRQSEAEIQRRIRLACGTGPRRLWRNNTGVLRDQSGRPVRFGLAPGSSDLIGYESIVITPAMVGQRLAVIAAIEVKTPGGRVSAQQQAFLDHVLAAGGRAGVARSPEEARAILEGKPQLQAGKPGMQCS